MGGNDILRGGGGKDTLIGGGKADTLDGGAGSDSADYTDSGRGVTVDLLNGTAQGRGNDTLVSIENVRGSGHGDLLIGDNGANILAGRGGNDTINGQGGDDTSSVAVKGRPRKDPPTRLAIESASPTTASTRRLPA